MISSKFSKSFRGDRDLVVFYNFLGGFRDFQKLTKHHQATSTPETLRKLTWNHLTLFRSNFEKIPRFFFVLHGPSPTDKFLRLDSYSFLHFFEIWEDIPNFGALNSRVSKISIFPVKNFDPHFSTLISVKIKRPRGRTAYRVLGKCSIILIRKSDFGKNDFFKSSRLVCSRETDEATSGKYGYVDAKMRSKLRRLRSQGSKHWNISGYLLSWSEI